MNSLVVFGNQEVRDRKTGNSVCCAFLLIEVANIEVKLNRYSQLVM